MRGGALNGAGGVRQLHYAGGDPAVTSVSVSPGTASVAKGGEKQFTATVTGTNSPAQTVTWTVEGGGTGAGTTISAAGLLSVAASLRWAGTFAMRCLVLSIFAHTAGRRYTKEGVYITKALARYRSSWDVSRQEMRVWGVMRHTTLKFSENYIKMNLTKYKINKI
jgi:hypothetical protein